MCAYYNEHDPEKAHALRALMAAGWIAPGEVDERDIRDVVPAELSGFAQCHFFAGIGLWSVAARAAGIPDDFPFWSGSCPCQPFSAAGAGAGFADPRHLWPHWYWLIAVCGPHAVVGEQVADKDGLAWLDLVSADMEGSLYAGGALDLCSAGIGAPNIRQRLYMLWLADALCDGTRHGTREGLGAETAIDPRDGRLSGQRLRTGIEGQPGGLANADGQGLDGGTGLRSRRSGQHRGPVLADDGRICPACGGSGRRGPYFPGGMSFRCANCDASGLVHPPEAGPQGRPAGRSPGPGQQGAAGQRTGEAGIVADAAGGRQPGQRGRGTEQAQGTAQLRDARGLAGPHGDGCEPGRLSVRQRRSGEAAPVECGHGAGGHAGPAAGPVRDPLRGPANGFWAGADWLLCRDPDGPKLRPVEPGTFCLAAGYPGRTGALRGYGDAINLQVATAFLQAVWPEMRGAA